jgi:hypothetical protein
MARTALTASASRALRELGLAGLLGGNLFGRFALHPAVAEISSKAERGKVVNAAWRRYGNVNSVSLAALTAGWLTARRHDSAAPPALTHAEDALIAIVCLLGAASAAEGVRFARLAPDGAVPLQDGSHPAPETPDVAARAKRRLNALGAASVAAELALAGVDAALAQPARHPLPRRLRRRF